MTDKFDFGNHLVVCDICGNKRYRTECDFTWDGFLACHTLNCWYPKDPLFLIPPIINDPLTIQDVRPEVRNHPDAPNVDQVGLYSTWIFIANPVATAGRIKWNQAHMRWGDVDSDPWALPE